MPKTWNDGGGRRPFRCACVCCSQRSRCLLRSREGMLSIALPLPRPCARQIPPLGRRGRCEPLAMRAANAGTPRRAARPTNIQIHRFIEILSYREQRALPRKSNLNKRSRSLARSPRPMACARPAPARVLRSMTASRQSSTEVRRTPSPNFKRSLTCLAVERTTHSGKDTSRPAEREAPTRGVGDRIGAPGAGGGFARK
jgi:hypothetical protein